MYDNPYALGISLASFRNCSFRSRLRAYLNSLEGPRPLELSGSKDGVDDAQSIRAERILATGDQLSQKAFQTNFQKQTWPYIPAVPPIRSSRSRSKAKPSRQASTSTQRRFNSMTTA